MERTEKMSSEGHGSSINQ